MIRILALLVEDEPLIFDALRSAFKKRRRPVDLLQADTLTEAAAILREAQLKATIDIVILDLALPDSSGTSTFYALQREFPDLPIIVLSGTIGDLDRIELARHGAVDVILKNGDLDATRLYDRIRTAVEAQEEVNQPVEGKTVTVSDIRELLRAEVAPLTERLDAQQRELDEVRRTDRYVKHAKVVGSVVAAVVVAALGAYQMLQQ